MVIIFEIDEDQFFHTAFFYYDRDDKNKGNGPAQSNNSKE